jgi:hypothetical protein
MPGSNDSLSYGHKIENLAQIAPRDSHDTVLYSTTEALKDGAYFSSFTITPHYMIIYNLPFLPQKFASGVMFVPNVMKVRHLQT